MDNLSRLPDELLLCIISKLSMKHAVRTSVLSKRWRYLYASRSSLIFYFGHNRTYDIKVPPIEAMNIVDRVFGYRNRCSSSINRFLISWAHRQDGLDPLRLQGWINSVMWHGIRNIDIHVLPNVLLPASLFTCETLVELRLHMISGPALDVPAKVYLPSLVVLKLSYVISFPYDDDASERLLTNCPVLECFDYCWKDGDCKLVVCHPTLKRLSISNLTKHGGGSIWINAPSLVYLRYFGGTNWANAPSLVYLRNFGFNLGSFTLINAQNLTEANISILVWFNEEQHTLCATNLMRGISHVHKLTIYGGFMIENLVENHVQMPVFNSLTHLEFSHKFGGGSSRFESILYFLESLKSLETLYFMDLPYVFNLDAWYAQEDSAASCLSFRLKTVKINLFRGSDEEMDMVKYLLQSARVLEVLDVGTSGIESPEKKLEIDKRLVMFPRASTACNVVVGNNNMLGAALPT